MSSSRRVQVSHQPSKSVRIATAGPLASYLEVHEAFACVGCPRGFCEVGQIEIFPVLTTWAVGGPMSSSRRVELSHQPSKSVEIADAGPLASYLEAYGAFACVGCPCGFCEVGQIEIFPVLTT